MPKTVEEKMRDYAARIGWPKGYRDDFPHGEPATLATLVEMLDVVGDKMPAAWLEKQAIVVVVAGGAGRPLLLQCEGDGRGTLALTAGEKKVEQALVEAHEVLGQWVSEVVPEKRSGRARFEFSGHAGYTSDPWLAGLFTEKEARYQERQFPRTFKARPYLEILQEATRRTDPVRLRAALALLERGGQAEDPAEKAAFVAGFKAARRYAGWVNETYDDDDPAQVAAAELDAENEWRKHRGDS